MTAAPPQVAVLILNWNGLADTLECLASLRHSTYANQRVIVWDNGSREDPGPALAAYPEVTLLRSERNLGFAAGCNRAAEYALGEGADFLLFLNNDTLVPPEMIACLVQAHAATANAGLVSVPEVNPIEPGTRYLGGQWQPLTCRARWRHAPLHACLPECLPLDIISGCVTLVSREVAARVGLFDEEFFAYFEDVDLSLRVQRAGGANVCATTSHVTHKGSRSSSSHEVGKAYLLYRGGALMVRKHAAGAGRITAPLHLLAGAVALWVKDWLRPGERPLMRARMAGLRDGWRRRPVDTSWLSRPAPAPLPEDSP